MTDEPMYLVWSNKQNAWWGPHGRYYTQDVWEAHRYTLEDAEKACTIRDWEPSKYSPEIAVKAPEHGRPPFTEEELRVLPQQMRRLIDDLNRMGMRERAAGPSTAAPAPCEAETRSWDHFTPEQMDSYWIRCTLQGPHDVHEDEHTGLTWADQPVPSGGTS